MSIAYFGHDAQGYYADRVVRETGQRTREYMTRELWETFIRAAGIPPTQGAQIALKIEEKLTLAKFNCEASAITDDTVPAEVINL